MPSATKVTWGDIKLATLQKLFSANGQAIQVDTSNAEYINAMPQAANEGLQLLSTTGKYIIRKYTYVNRPISPVYGLMGSVTIAGDKWTCRGANVKSYCFKCRGKIHLAISAGGITLYEMDFADEDFNVHKGLVSGAEDDDTVVFTFSSKYPSIIRNIALYGAEFEHEEDVPEYEKYIRINMDDAVDDFYQLAPNEIYTETDEDPYFVSADQYFQEAGRCLVIPRDQEGDYTIYYRAYPKQITFKTEDTYVLSIAPEVAALLPLYMASQLYKDDDNGIATTYRNEFEVGREALSQMADVGSIEEFSSVTGWV